VAFKRAARTGERGQFRSDSVTTFWRERESVRGGGRLECFPDIQLTQRKSILGGKNVNSNTHEAGERRGSKRGGRKKKFILHGRGARSSKIGTPSDGIRKRHNPTPGLREKKGMVCDC